MSTIATPTRRQAEKVLADVRERFAGWFGVDDPASGPQLIMDWDWLGHGGRPSIVWEEGPFEWAYSYTAGGMDDETRSLLLEVLSADAVAAHANSEQYQPGEPPEGYFFECITSWAFGIYPI